MKTNLISKTMPSLLILAIAFLFASKHTFAADLELSPSDSNITSSESSGLLAVNQQPPRPNYGDTPEDSIQCIRNLSLYTEYYNQRNFQLAFDPWREAYQICPGSSQNIFIRGIVLVKMKYNEETDPLKREAWVDTLMMIYDDRIKYWGHSPSSREGLVLGRKAVDLFTYRPNNVMEVYEISKRSIEIEGNRSQADVLLVNMQMLIRLVEAGLEPVSKILETYDILMNIVDFNLENNPADERFFAPAKGQIDAMFEPYATCENIITLFQPRFDREPENIELLEKVTSMLSNSGCTEEKLFFDATRNLHRLQPNANSAFLMGRLENNRQNYRDAIKYFEEAVSLYENESDKFTALMLLADITYRNLRQFSQARSYALQASAIDPENGRPYILIGEMYAASASACGDNDLTKTVAYWAAVDKFIQARNVDKEQIVQERANQLINTFSQYFPSIEIIFFYGLSEGDSYRVECWINETTRVRPRR
jgi:tetratricopeptide (TPR) repeat protein